MTKSIVGYVKLSNKRDRLGLIPDDILTNKITDRKIACVPLNLRKGACLCGITKMILQEIHFTILVIVLPII